MTSQGLQRGHIIVNLKENVRGESEQREADWHVEDVRHPVAGGTEGRERLQSLGSLKAPVHKHREVDNSTAGLIEAKQEKWLEVVVAHAVAYPRAVMVHLRRAPSTSMAMVRPIRLPTPAMRACT